MYFVSLKNVILRGSCRILFCTRQRFFSFTNGPLLVPLCTVRGLLAEGFLPGFALSRYPGPSWLLIILTENTGLRPLVLCNILRKVTLNEKGRYEILLISGLEVLLLFFIVAVNIKYFVQRWYMISTRVVKYILTNNKCLNMEITAWEKIIVI